MGMIIRANTTFKHYVDNLVTLPIGLKIHFDFGGSIELSKTNRVTGMAATVAGVPIVNANSVIVNHMNGFLTDLLAATTDRTYLIISRSAVNSILCGHQSYDYSAKQPQSTGLVMTNSKFSLQCMSNLFAATESQTNVGTDVKFFAATVSGTSAKSFVGLNNAILIKEATVLAISNTLPFIVGAYNTKGSTFPNSVETFEVLYFDRALGEVEIQSMYQQLKKKYANKGILIS